MYLNAIISLIKSNAFEDAKKMLDKAKKQPHFSSLSDQSTLKMLEVYFFIKEKQLQEGLDALAKLEQNVETIFLRAHLLLGLKKQKESIQELIKFTLNDEQQSLTQLILRIAHNYKLLDLPEVKQFVQKIVEKQMIKAQKTGQVDIRLLESLISIKEDELAYKLMGKCNVDLIK